MPPYVSEKFKADTVPIKVSGIVTDAETDQRLPGVTIGVMHELNVGATTNVKGKFEVFADASDTLLISYLGYKTVQFPIKGQKDVIIQMMRTIASLKGVIVVGYGTKQKTSVTGAISQIGSKVFESRPLTNASSALQGAIPGLTVLRESGQPGREGYDLQIRGYSSVNGNAPLVLIDGVAGDINNLNPYDIANVTVLKDAAASIYGARAADGVILITTKKGRKGPPAIEYTANFGIKTPDFLKKMTTTAQLAEMDNEALTNVGLPGIPDSVFTKIRNNAPPDIGSGWVTYLQNYPGFYQYNNWNKILYGNAIQQIHNLNVTGGSENSSYLFSAGYSDNNGVFRNIKDNSKRYNLRMNYDFKLFNKINIETRNSYNNEIISEPSSIADVMHNASRMFDFVPLRNPQGEYYTYQGFVNPLQELAEGGRSLSNLNTFSFNVKADVEILKGLKLTGQVGINKSNNNANTNYRTFNEYDYTGGLQGLRNPLNSADYTSDQSLYKSYTGFIEYSKSIRFEHTFSLMAGTSFEKNIAEGTSVNGSNFPGNELFTLNLADQTQAAYTQLNGYNTDWALASYFSRFSYAFRNKFFLDATIRIDGSSKFSPQERWSAVFPAVSAAYNFTEEKFIESLRFINNLKLRASWGKAGNQNISAFSNYGYIPLVSIGGAYPLGSPNTGLPGATSSIASSTRTWETIETSNLGLDFGFLENRLTGSFDIYNKQNRNMLVDAQVPVTLGGTPPSQNLGHLVTKGFDLSLGWRDQIRRFKYSVTFIISDSKNKLVELQGNDVLSPGLNYAHQGYPINSYFGYEFNGIIQNEKQLTSYKKLGGIPNNIGIGDVMFKDIDGDGEITTYGDPAKGSKGDLIYLGSLSPRYTYSSNISLSYGNFDLSVLIQGVGKEINIRDGSFAVPLSAIYFQPLQYFYGKEWTPSNTHAKYPRLIPGSVGFDNLLNYNWQYSSMRVDNLAYLRFKVITIGYNLPSLFCKKLKITSARIYISGEDLFTISKGTWDHSFDPEEGYQRSDEQTYPFSKVKSIGLDIKF